MSVALIAIIYPMYGLEITVSQNMTVSFYFVIASLARSYLLRRVFSYVDRTFPTTK